MTLEELWYEGAKAYRYGKKESENPFKAFEQCEDYIAWQHGYRIEKQEHEQPVLAEWDSRKYGTGPLTGDY